MNNNFFNDIPVFDNSWKENINEDKRKINKRENFNIPKIESSHNLKSEENMSINIVTDNKEFKRLHLENTNVLDKQFQKKSPDDSYQDYKNVGIIDNIDTVKDHVPYNLFQEFNKKDNFNDSVKNMINPTILSGVFFSRKNINNVQNKIKKGIKDLTGYDIGNQSEEELEIIMRSIYLQFSKNSDCEIQSQISQLNEEVLKYSVKNIYTNVKQYLGYLKTLTDEPDFDKFPKSISTNIKGKKEYRLDTLINFDFPSNM